MANNNNEARITFRAFTQEFDKAIGGLKNEASKLRKEFQLQEEQLKQNGTASDRLAAKVQYLRRNQELARQQVEETRKQLERAKATFGENSQEAENLARKLLDAQIAEQRFSNQVSAAERELAKLEQRTGTTGQALSRLEEEGKQLASQTSKLTAEYELQKAQLGVNASEVDQLGLKLSYLQRQQQLAGKEVRNTERQLELARQVYGENSVEVERLESRLMRLRTVEQRLSNEVSQTNTSLNHQADALRESQSRLGKMSQSLDEAGNKFKGLGDSINSTVTPAIAGVGAISVKSASDIDGATRQLISSLGATGEEAEQLKRDMLAVWEGGYAESADEVARAMGRVKQNMHNIGGGLELRKATEDALTLAKVFEADVNEVTRGANQLMENFGLSADKAFGLLTRGAQNGLNFSGELFDNVAEYAPLFEEMGFSAENYFSILINGAENGAYNLDYINDVMKEFQIRVKDGSKATSDAMSQMSTKTRDVWKEFLAGKATVADVFNTVIPELERMDDQVLANQIGVGLFGTKWEDLESDVMYSLDNQTDALKGYGGAIDEVGDSIENSIGQKAQATLRKLMGVLEPLGLKVIEMLNGAAPHIQSFVDRFTSMSPLFQNLVIIFGLVGIALGPLIAIFGQLILGMAAITGKLTLYSASASRAAASSTAYGGSMTRAGRAAAAASTRVGLLGRTMGILAGPFRLLGTLLMMFLPHIILFIAKNEEAKAALSGAWKSIWQAVQPVIASLGDAFNKISPLLNQAMGAIAPILGGLMTTIARVVQSIGPSLSSLGSAIGSIFGTIVQTGGSLLTALAPVFESVVSIVQNLLVALQPAIQQLSQMFVTLAPQFQQTGQIIAESFKTLGPAFAELGVALGELGVALGQAFGMLAQALIPIAITILPQLMTAFISVLPVILNVVMAVIPVVIQLIQAIIPIVLQIIIQVLPLFLQVVQMVFPIILQVIQMVLPLVIQLILMLVPVILQLAQTIIPLILKTVQAVFPIILSIIKMVIPVIITVITMAATIITKVLIPAIQFILKIVQIVFPAIMSIIQSAIRIITNVIKLFTSVLKGDWRGAWDAIKGITQSVSKIIGTIISAAKDTIVAIWKTLKSIVVSVVSGMWDSIVSKFESLKGAVSQRMEKVKSTIKDIWNQAKAFLEGIDLVGIGKNIIQGLVNGITSMGGSIKKKVSELASNIPAWAKKMLGIHSPSRVMAEVGRDTGRGLAVGLDDSRKTVKASTTNILTDLIAFNGRVAKEMQKNKAKQHQITAAQIESSKNWYDKKKYYNQLSLADELKYFEYLVKLAKNNSKEREAAEREVYRVKKEINEKLTSLNSEYVQKIADANQRLADNEKALTEEYNRSVEERTKSLYSFVGLFDEVKAKSDVSGQGLINNLRGQVNTFAEWAANIKFLAAKGIDKGLLGELEAMGPSAAAEVAALTRLTAVELGEYTNLWREKNRLARNQATTEMQGLKQETSNKIKALRAETARELEGYKKEWTAKIKEITTGTKDEFVKMNTSMSDIGKNSIQGLIKGMSQMSGPLVAQAKSMANTVAQTIKNTLQIKSPSRVLMGLGRFAGEGLAVGMEKMKGTVSRASEILAANAIPELSGSNLSEFLNKSKQRLQASLELIANSKLPPIHIHLVNEIDGYAFTQATAKYINEALGQESINNLVINGVGD